MIHPSYVDLMKVMNSGVEFGEEPVVKKPLSTAVQELYEGKVKIIGDDNEEEEEV